MELVRLTTAPNEVEAELIRAVLRVEGIESMQRLTDLGASGLGGEEGMGGLREILVRASDLDTARAVTGT
jgi:hypothetical protein